MCALLACVEQLFVRQGDQVFRDEVIWDVSNPQNTADTYAIRVCADLRLGCDWYDAITTNLKARLEEIRQVHNYHGVTAHTALRYASISIHVESE